MGGNIGVREILSCAQLKADDILPGSLLRDNKTALAGFKVLSYIVGTWNFVNTTSNDGTGTSATTGTITFKGGGYDQNSGSSASFIETTNGKIVHAIIGCDIINGKTVCRPIGVWTSDGYTLALSYYVGAAPTLTFITTSPNHMN